MIFEKVKDLCDQNNVSISALEKSTDLSHGTIAKWDRMKPKAESLYKVAKFFDKPMEYFLEGESDETVNR